jgi:hypothetical protein
LRLPDQCRIIDIDVLLGQVYGVSRVRSHRPINYPMQNDQSEQRPIIFADSSRAVNRIN